MPVLDHDIQYVDSQFLVPARSAILPLCDSEFKRMGTQECMGCKQPTTALNFWVLWAVNSHTAALSFCLLMAWSSFVPHDRGSLVSLPTLSIRTYVQCVHSEGYAATLTAVAVVATVGGDAACGNINNTGALIKLYRLNVVHFVLYLRNQYMHTPYIHQHNIYATYMWHFPDPVRLTTSRLNYWRVLLCSWHTLIFFVVVFS